MNTQTLTDEFRHAQPSPVPRAHVLGGRGQRPPTPAGGRVIGMAPGIAITMNNC